MNPKGDADTKIESLDKTGDDYRLKPLRETDLRREQLYKSIRETSYLEPDYIRITEKGDPPEHDEAKSIVESTIKDNESLNDISKIGTF